MEAGRTENRKLIYELSKIARSSENSSGLIYYKESLTEDGSFRKIWAKRAYKKGYCDIAQETESYYLFRINSKGIDLLGQFPEFYLFKQKMNYNNLTVKERRELRRQQHRENIL